MDTTVLLVTLVLLAVCLVAWAIRRAQVRCQEWRHRAAKRLDPALLPQQAHACLCCEAAAEHRALQHRMMAANREQDAAALHVARLMLTIAHACRNDQRQP